MDIKLEYIKNINYILYNYIIIYDNKYDLIYKCLKDKNYIFNYINNNNNSKEYILLFYSIITNNYKCLKLLIEKGYDINKRFNNNNICLSIACYDGDVKIVQLLLDNGADIYQTDKYFGRTALEEAFYNNKYDIVNLFFGRYYSQQLMTNVLINSIKEDNKKLSGYIIFNNKDNLSIFNSLNGNNESALLIACKLENYELAKIIIKHSNKVINTKCNEGYNCLMISCDKGYYNIIELLLNNGADIDINNEYGDTCLFKSYKNKIEILKLLLKYNPNINHQNNFGDTCLIIACKKAHLYIYHIYKIIELLISSGADINIQNKYGKTCLFYSCSYPYQKINEIIVKLLINNGADVNILNNQNNNCLQVACIKGCYNIVKILYENGVNVENRSKTGDTALMYASRYNNVDIVEYLISIVNNFGKSAIEQAIINKNYNIVKILISHGAYINDRLLNLSINLNAISISKLLLASGCDYAYNVSHNKNNKLKYINDYLESYEYDVLKNKKSSNIFSLIVLTSDNYFNLI